MNNTNNEKNTEQKTSNNAVSKVPVSDVTQKASVESGEMLDLILGYFEAIDFTLHKHPNRSDISQRLDEIERGLISDELPSLEVLKERINKAVKRVVTARVLEIIYKATGKEYFTMEEVCEITSVPRGYLNTLSEMGFIVYEHRGHGPQVTARDLRNVHNPFTVLEDQDE